MDTERELIDYLRIIWRKKWLIIGGTLLGGLIAFFLTFFKDPVFQVNASVSPGKLAFVDVDKFVTSRSAVPLKIFQDNLPWILSQAENTSGTKLNHKNSLRVNARTNDILEISVTDTDAATAKEELGFIIEVAMSWLNRQRDLSLLPLAAKIDRLKIEQGLFQAEMDLIQEKRQLLIKRGADRLQLLETELDVSEKKRELLRVENNLTFNSGLLDRSTSYTLHTEPSVVAGPANSRKKMTCAVALLLGLVISTLTAFLLDYVERGRAS